MNLDLDLNHNSYVIGIQRKPCKENSSIEQLKHPDVQCRCLSGFELDVSNPKDIKCKKCPKGTFSNGFHPCKACPDGQAAVPGYFLDAFTEDRLPSVLKQDCSGTLCQVIIFP